MNRSLLMEGSRSQLVNQLVYLDEEKTHFLNHYYPENNQKRTEVERMLSMYSSALERIVSDLDEENLNSMALIGSRLELRYLDDNSIEAFTIVFPHYADPNQNLISFLSPMGFQLLRAKVHETYRLAVPSGQISVRVETIRFMNKGDVN
jgi:transcription elongation factor GreA